MVFWLAHSPGELSARAKATIADAREHGALSISDKTLWELAMIFRNDRITLRTTTLAFLEVVEAQFHVLPVSGAIAAQAVQFSANFPHDPADRIIAATAVVHQAQLLTRDKRIHASKELDCIW